LLIKPSSRMPQVKFPNPLLILLSVLLSACSTISGASGGATVKVGALFPLTGSQAPLAKQEYAGVQIARDFVNADGGIKGMRISLDTREVTDASQAASRVDALRADGVSSIIGAYSSSLSMPISAAAQADGLLYWEAGAVADQLTGRGYPLVFRVGATGSNLGTMSSHFAATVLAPRLNRAPSQLRMVIVHNVDGYPTSVATAVEKQAHVEGIPVVGEVQYDAHVPDWPAVLDQVRVTNPNILVLASYIADGVDFRRAMLKAGLHVDAFLGSTMAQCVPDFGVMMGADAIGVFASDRPPGWGFNPQALNKTGQAIYDRFAEAYEKQAGGYPTEEALAGFSAAWTLFHYVMPGAQGHDSEALASAARSLDLPTGSLANGAGVKFATTPDLMGQNLRAASVIWQWQGVRQNVTVYPPVFATGAPSFIPLPR
jgi:branched-chain amino acid transport system substrate-binding protein